MYEINCTYQGLVPMMHDRLFNPEELEIGASKKRGKNAWKELLKYQMYYDKKGVYLPADNIRMMLIGNRFRPGAAEIQGSYIETKKGKKYKKTCESCIWVIGTEDPQKVYLNPRRKTFDDYDERSFINAQGSRSLKRRPIFKCPWSLQFIIQVVDDRIDESFVRTLFEVAGLRCGAGAYGPTFGRCVITQWSIINKTKKKSNSK